MPDAQVVECELEVALPQVRTSPRREPSFALVRVPAWLRVQNQALAPPGAGGHGSEDACRPRHVGTNKRHRSSRRPCHEQERRHTAWC
jgi:hypothetical protein